MSTESPEEISSQEVTKQAILLLVISEPVIPLQRDSVIAEIGKGLRSWNVKVSGCSILSELEKAQSSFAISDEGPNGEKVLSYSSEKVFIEVLLYPTLKLLQIKLKQFFTREGLYRHLVYAGPCVKGAGKWLLQDALFSWNSFLEIFQSSEVSSAIKQNIVQGSVYINSHVDNHMLDAKFSKATGLKFKLNAQFSNNGETFDSFVEYISQFIIVIEAKSLLKSTDVVGNIRFNRPTIYIFPACQGDSALFGVNGFNLLVDGGYSRRSCFWDFIRHLDRLDAIIITHFSLDNYYGINSLLLKKGMDGLKQEIGCVFVNSVKEAAKFCHGSNNTRVDIDSLSKSSVLIESMKMMNMILKPCFSNNMQPINLYHKVGHGSLDLFVLNPAQNSKNLNEFLTMWSKNVDPFISKVGLSLSEYVSICAILVWKPAAPYDTITRVLFPGSVNQNILFDGLEKLKNLSMFQHPTCTEKELNPPKPEKKLTKVAPKADLVSPKSDNSSKSKKTLAPKKESSGDNISKASSDKDVTIKHSDEDKIKAELVETDKQVDGTEDKVADPSGEMNVEVHNVPLPLKDDNILAEPVADLSNEMNVEVLNAPAPQKNENILAKLDTDLTSKMNVEVLNAPTPEKDDNVLAKPVADPSSEMNVEVPDVPRPHKDDNILDNPDDEGTDSLKVDNDSPKDSKCPEKNDDDLDKHVETLPENVQASRQDSLENLVETVSEDATIEKVSDDDDVGSLDMNKLQEGLKSSANEFNSISNNVDTKCHDAESATPQSEPKNDEKQEPDLSDEVKTWDKPLGVPPPMKTVHKPNVLSASKRPSHSTRAAAQTSKQGASKYAQKLGNIIYLDLAYVPQHADPHHVDITFFKKVRARYYVFSTICPDAGVLTALLEGKQTWEDPNLEVTIIPTYDTEVLRYWMAAHQEQLSQNRITVAPAANRCTIQLQDHETSCAAYRLEF